MRPFLNTKRHLIPSNLLVLRPRRRAFVAILMTAACVATCLSPTYAQNSPEPLTSSRQSSASTNRAAIEIRLLAEAERPPAFFSGPALRFEGVADDAALNDVCGVGQQAWAVGERGVVLRSTDSGLTWSTEILPFECSLHSVCFLTNQTGYIAGSRFNEYERQHQGILLATKDGGASWKLIEGKPLPPIRQIKFFDLDNAVAICVPDQPNSPSQVLRSQDGGASWQQLESDIKTTRWSAGDFLSPQDGILAGGGNSYGALVSDQIVALAEPQQTLRQVHGACLTRSGSGWLAGDAGFLLQSENGGISWKPADTKLPARLNDVFDFRSVDQNGANVCVAGSPGNFVFSSSDSGQTWKPVPSGCPTPLSQVRFINESTVIAVGAFGVIHHSSNGGQTWQNVRNGNYRSAVLCVVANTSDTSMRMLAATSGEEGYRSVVLQPSARLPQLNIDDSHSISQLQVAASQAGANYVDQDWMFARTQPMQEMVRDEILSAWGQQTDGRVGELLPQRLAEQIRIWRPDAITVDFTGTEDQLGPLLLQALEPAIQIAASNSADGPAGLLSSCGLAPVEVTRIVSRVSGDAGSPLSFQGDALLPNLQTSTDLIANFCQRQLRRTEGTTSPEVRMQPSSDSYTAYSSQRPAATPAQLLAGLSHAPGTESRRALPITSSENRDRLERLARNDRTQRAALTGHLQQAETPLALIANLHAMGNDMPAALALKQLQHLASLYASVENLEGEIAVLKEISLRFPDSPDGADANEKLFQYYSSGELRFLRRLTDPAAPEDELNNAASRIPGLSNPTVSGIQQTAAGAQNSFVTPAITNRGTGSSLPNSAGNERSAMDANWDLNANKALTELNRVAPQRANSAEVLLRHAANLLRQDTYGKNRSVLTQAASGDGLYSLLAQAEMQSMHGTAETIVPILNLPKAESKPFLDGNLTEPCWQDALEVHLLATTESARNPDCLIMFAWDEDHIYVAGRIERTTNREDRMNQAAPRRHDTKHGTNDRIEFMFDTDRDYTTGFHFVIDEAGQTSERCWRAGNWNPDWFLASESDADVWRFELAIPQAELQEQPIRPGALWAIRVQRTVPGILQQSLKDKDHTSDLAGADGFGLLRFIRNKK
ncbi:MAG: YCF48-related protein [Fuerstiella sp.]